jgi:hypothetical protein
VNARARALIADLRALLARHPLAQGIDAHAGAWLQVHITVGDAGDVDALAAELELGPPKRMTREGVSWTRAASSEDGDAITVIGPYREKTTQP